MKYRLEIYKPGSASEILESFVEEGPFGAISRGDLINPRLYAQWEHPGKMLRVLHVEHVVAPASPDGDGEVIHAVMIYSERVSDTELERLQPFDD